MKPATASDCGFMQDATNNSQKITTDAIEKVFADGAYNSSKNQKYCYDNNMNFILTELQMPKRRYDLTPNKQNSHKLTVKDNKIGNIIDAVLVKFEKRGYKRGL